MKARLKENRKIIVDVVPYFTDKTFKDVNSDRVYDAEELEIIEYYGG